MSRYSKIREKLFAATPPRNFTWEELKYLFCSNSYEVRNGGGSRRKFVNQETKHFVNFHKPHPGNELKAYMVKLAKEAVQEMEERQK